MKQNQVNIKILVAAVLMVSASFLVSLAHVNVPVISIYAFIFTAVNFAGYTFVYNRTRRPDKTVPVGVTSAIAVMLSAGFTAATAISFTTKLPPLQLQNAVAYLAMFVVLTAVLLPDQAIDMIE